MLDSVMITLSWILLGMLFIYPFALAVLQDLCYFKTQNDNRSRVRKFNFIFLMLFGVLVMLYADGELIAHGAASYYAWLAPSR